MTEKQEQTLLKHEKASLQKKLLDAAAAKPQQSGKIVNAYGQEEVGIPKWQQKAAAVRQMYESCSTSADVGHQQRILQQLEDKKRARASGHDEKIRGLASSSYSAVQSGTGDGEASKRLKINSSSSDSDTSSDTGGKERKKDKKKKKAEKKKKNKKDKKRSKKNKKEKS